MQSSLCVNWQHIAQDYPCLSCLCDFWLKSFAGDCQVKVDLFMSIGSTSVQAKLTCSGGDIASTFLLVFYRGFFYSDIYYSWAGWGWRRVCNAENTNTKLDWQYASMNNASLVNALEWIILGNHYLSR